MIKHRRTLKAIKCEYLQACHKSIERILFAVWILFLILQVPTRTSWSGDVCQGTSRTVPRFLLIFLFKVPEGNWIKSLSHCFLQKKNHTLWIQCATRIVSVPDLPQAMQGLTLLRSWVSFAVFRRSHRGHSEWWPAVRCSRACWPWSEGAWRTANESWADLVSCLPEKIPRSQNLEVYHHHLCETFFTR